MTGRRLWLVPLLVAVACGGDDDVVTRRVELTPSDQVQRIELEVGQQLELELEANATTGYQWEISEEPAAAVVVPLGSDYEGGGGNGAPGTGGAEVWTFEAAGPGTTEMQMRYHFPGRPEEQGAIYEFTIEVAP